VLLLLGGLAVGVLAPVARQLGGNSQDVLFSGQASVPSVVAATSTKVVLVVLVAKALGYAVSLGCGFQGGPIFPAIFLAVALASLPVVWFDASPTLAVAVGVAAGMAAQSGLLFSPILFAALLVGEAGTDAIPAAVLAAVAAWLTRAALDRRSKPPQPEPRSGCPARQSRPLRRSRQSTSPTAAATMTAPRVALGRYRMGPVRTSRTTGMQDRLPGGRTERRRHGRSLAPVRVVRRHPRRVIGGNLAKITLSG
jgi:hypothetical protein